MTKVYEFNAAELRLLGAAARLIDETVELQAALDADGPIVKGSRGTPVAHPALKELRDHRALYGRLVKQLQLPDADAEPETWTTKRAREAAQERWRQEREHNERTRSGRTA